jgi:hypothetical protein
MGLVGEAGGERGITDRCAAADQRGGVPQPRLTLVGVRRQTDGPGECAQQP